MVAERRARGASGLMTISAYRITSTSAGMKRGRLHIGVILLFLSSGNTTTEKLLESVQL
jgi:hypothetical protein